MAKALSAERKSLICVREDDLVGRLMPGVYKIKEEDIKNRGGFG